MSAAMESMVFSGVAKRMRREAKEGAEQGLKFFDYLVSRASKVELLTITQAATDYKSILHAFEVALNPKRKVTGFIDKM
jgi:ferritin